MYDPESWTVTPDNVSRELDRRRRERAEFARVLLGVEDGAGRERFYRQYRPSIPAVRPSTLREQARALKAFSRQPIRARRCGDDDAESERKALAGYRARLLLAVARQVEAERQNGGRS